MSETPNEAPVPEWIPPADPDTELPRPAVKDAGDGDLNPGPEITEAEQAEMDRKAQENSIND